ncbi:hypothetical protein Q4489_18010 [Thalassotalea sp. 1_MG-2023]|nr:hypothetical protein [Thalassotalea sp. 1_MG-2023]MDO6428898.1 hypothetical protein [Thalassotalea sp. 1_MG-2023]
MNFYQRANLTFSLAVLIGFEFTLTNSLFINKNGKCPNIHNLEKHGFTQ